MKKPATLVTYMGAEWDLLLKRMRLAPSFVKKWEKWLPLICAGHFLPLKTYWSALGVLAYAQRVLEIPGCQIWPMFEWARAAARNSVRRWARAAGGQPIQATSTSSPKKDSGREPKGSGNEGKTFTWGEGDPTGRTKSRRRTNGNNNATRSGTEVKTHGKADHF